MPITLQYSIIFRMIGYVFYNKLRVSPFILLFSFLAINPNLQIMATVVAADLRCLN